MSLPEALLPVEGEVWSLAEQAELVLVVAPPVRELGMSWFGVVRLIHSGGDTGQRPIETTCEVPLGIDAGHRALVPRSALQHRLGALTARGEHTLTELYSQPLSDPSSSVPGWDTILQIHAQAMSTATAAAAEFRQVLLELLAETPATARRGVFPAGQALGEELEVWPGPSAWRAATAVLFDSTRQDVGAAAAMRMVQGQRTGMPGWPLTSRRHGFEITSHDSDGRSILDVAGLPLAVEGARLGALVAAPPASAAPPLVATTPVVDQRLRVEFASGTVNDASAARSLVLLPPALVSS